MINEREFFTKDGKLVPGFRGIGPFVGRRVYEFSRDEQTLLNYWWTNIDSNVYCAKDTMPSQLWALIIGQFARAGNSAKERSIDEYVKASKRTPELVPSLEAMASMIRKGEDVTNLMDTINKNVGNMIETYGIGYGHGSLRDSGTVRTIFEGVSQRATKFIESAREGAYQEVSTRAVPFTLDNLGMPLEVRGTPFEKRFLALAQKSAMHYDRIRGAAGEWLNNKYGYLRNEADVQVRELTGNKNAKLGDRDWNSVIESKAFDLARTLIPQFMITSLGLTLTARRFQDQLTELQSNEFEELRVLGRAAQIESMKIMDSLMKYGDSSPFYKELPGRRRDLVRKFGHDKMITYGQREIKSTLIAHTPDIEDWALASILFNGGANNSIVDLKNIVSQLSFDERRRIAKSQFDGRESYELVPKTMEIGSLMFERVIDIGAYRDVQRQRGDRQQATPYGVWGFYMPEEIRELRSSELGTNFERGYEEVMFETKQLYDDLIKKGMHSAAEYALMMANTIRHVVTEDPVQAMYFEKLRAQAAGADTYRSIAIQEGEQREQLMPAFAGLVNYDKTPRYPLNRLPEKIRMIAKERDRAKK